ncbi:MAG TPA: NAD(P)/FAD-dependent oxidoreductase, partial [Bryobacteraceae bacterium]|nr:NAD(P)/FAD-dependent oxidoreductase [Bryobacteraceae bacterium]
MTDSPDNSARDHYDVLIVGAGHGGAQAALSLRQFKFAGSIALLGEEREPPYERPPLSKDYFAGEKSFERILIRPVAQWAQREIELLPGRRVTGVDAAAHRVTLADGTGIGYDALIWAAGGSPRRLPCPGSALSGVHAVRTRADVDAILKELPSTQQVVVIGGGYIGLEAAAVLSKFGKRVTLLEAQDRVLARVAGAPLSRFYEHEHRVHGVDVRVGVQVTALEGTDGRVSAVRLADGTLLGTDLVIVGIGIIPAVEPLRAAGAAGSDGVDVDAQCRTSLPDVFAIGDCATHENAFAGGARVRL